MQQRTLKLAVLTGLVASVLLIHFINSNYITLPSLRPPPPRPDDGHESPSHPPPLVDESPSRQLYEEPNEEDEPPRPAEGLLPYAYPYGAYGHPPRRLITPSEAPILPQIVEHSLDPEDYDFEIAYQHDDQKFKVGQGNLPYVRYLDEVLFANASKATEDPSMTLFQYRSDKSSLYPDILDSHANSLQFCDKSTIIRGCDYHLKHDYVWDTLSVKLLESIKHMCVNPRKSEIYIKVDDDTVAPTSELQYLARMLHNGPCLMAGTIATDYTFYWATGQLYLFKRELLETVCARMRNFTISHHAEDITLGMVFNSTNPDEFCNIPGAHFWHKNYEDYGVKVHFKEIHDPY